MTKFILTTRTNGEFQFNLTAANDRVLLSSEGYKAITDCNNGISSVKMNCINDKLYEKLSAKNGKHYFNLKATNGQVIATSPMLETPAIMDTWIASVKAHGPNAEIVDKTVVKKADAVTA